MKDPTFIIILYRPDATSVSHFTLRVSDDPVHSARSHVGIRIALSTRAKRAVSEWIQVSSIGWFCGRQQQSTGASMPDRDFDCCW